MRKIAILLVIALLAACCAGCAKAPEQTEAPETEKVDRAEAAAEAEAPEEEREVLVAETPEEAEAETEFEVVLGSQTEPAEEAEPDAPAPEEPPEPDAPEAAATPAEPSESDSDLYINEFTVEDLVLDIRAWYQDIVFDTTLTAEQFGDAATVFLRDGEVVSIAEYDQLNDDAAPAMQTVNYYYRDGEPFFVFITYQNWELEEVRLYFYEGNLIRWIEDDNLPNDNVPHAEWQAYYDRALDAMVNAQNALRS
ncbi:MAG: hypothetical protein IIY16_02490 [Oscillospiraceae bacterium]|nr:hypothetical protein [Oscillospiraceae bacterium]